ncbi:uncharacterized protein HKW66_Vig0009650 [Vigna angularis]|uniref:Uncharacterized protein n=1 Tax=Phaseolus angularis TaxID=3914 RepID=A0A8T0LBZ1_PHAAN|nr:uncharacterized protein HKW66_Vig0009650 [Vigna angularis]
MVSPSVVVLVDSKGWADMATTAASSFRHGVVSNLEYYSMMLESLYVSTAGGGGEWVRRIEMMQLRPKLTSNKGTQNLASFPESGSRGAAKNTSGAKKGM